MKKIIFVLFIIFLLLNVNGEIKYKVSGKVIRNNKGYGNAKITVSALELYDNKDAKNVSDQTIKTSSEGKFQFYLLPGKYYLFCEYIPSPKGEIYGLRNTGPKEFIVKNKNLTNITLKLFKVTEFIQENLAVLDEIPQSIPTVKYKYGRIPIYSESNCRATAIKELESIKKTGTELDSVLKGSIIAGAPRVFYDFQNNPIFYQFPVKNIGVIVGSIDISAIGSLEPEANDSEYREISLSDLKNRRNEFLGKKWGVDVVYPFLLKNIANKMGFDKTNLELVNYICIGPDSLSLYFQVKNKLNNKSYYFNTDNGFVEWSDDDINKIREESETMITYYYIQDVIDSRE